ncbi:MAG: hypothetical protein V4584_03155 [Verrucomicrobiota bacterium]
MNGPSLCRLLFFSLTAVSRAGTPGEILLKPTPSEPRWEFRASGYGWLTGLDGSVGVGGLGAELDVGFLDIADDLKMAAALQVEARDGRWGILADGFYVNLGASGPSPGPIYDSVGMEMKQFIGELSLAYRVYESPCGFVDLYAGLRYNNLAMDLDASADPAGIRTVSENASNRVAEGIGRRSAALARSRLDAFQGGSAADRAVIESALVEKIEAEADGRLKRDLAKQLLLIRREGGLDARDIASARINIAVKNQRLQLARAAARLEVAKLRAKVDASLEAGVTRARSKALQAETNLAAAINKQLVGKVPTTASADKDWLDPMVGVRAQWNINERVFLRGKSDIGGFGVGSDLAWTLQACAGYNLTRNVSAELGYRYLHTDYADGSFKYDLAQAGLFTSLNIRF